MSEEEIGLSEKDEPVRNEEEEERNDECREGDLRDGEVSCGTGMCAGDDARGVEGARVADEASRDASGASLREDETEEQTAETVSMRSDERKKARDELLEFFELFPGVPFSDIPAEVRESALPLAAAYALYERREKRRAARAATANDQNRARSAGRVTDGEETFYSPDEVRRMTRAEVRADFDAVMRSMKKWK